MIYKTKLLLTFTSLFNYISPSILHLPSMMHRNVVADHSSKELLLHMLTFFTPPTHDGHHHPSTLWVPRRCQQLSSSLVFSTCFFTGLHTSMIVDFLTSLHTSMSADFLTGLHTPMDYTPNFKHCNPNLGQFSN